MGEIRFKATRKNANSCDGYRQIIKSGDLNFDRTREDDDVIQIFKEDIESFRIIIDCDKKTGEFCIKF